MEVFTGYGTVPNKNKNKQINHGFPCNHRTPFDLRHVLISLGLLGFSMERIPNESHWVLFACHLRFAFVPEETTVRTVGRCHASLYVQQFWACESKCWRGERNKKKEKKRKAAPTWNPKLEVIT